jgi:hypothetical protein
MKTTLYPPNILVVENTFEKKIVVKNTNVCTVFFQDCALHVLY